MKRLALGLMLAFVPAVLVPAADETRQAKYEVEVVKNVSYNDSKDADDVRHKLDLYLPKGAKDYPVLFYIHGGGWTKGSKESFARHGKMFASRGIGCVSVNYRLSPKIKHPDHI